MPIVDSSSPAPRATVRALRAVALLSLFALPIAGGWLNLLQVFRDGVNGVQGLNGASGVAVSPDGLEVYATSSLDDSLVVFRRDASQDTLDYSLVFQDGVFGVFGLDGASSTAASGDTRHIYAAAAGSDSLAVFRRDASLETYAFADVLLDGVGGIFGLEGATDVAVTPDDTHVLVTAGVSSALTMFRRDASLDDLTFVDVETSWFGLGDASAVATNADGSRVFVTGTADDALAIFSRSGDELTFVESHGDGFSGVDGLDGASDVVVSPDGQHVYVSGAVDDAVAVFQNLGANYAFQAVYRDGVAGVDGLDGAAALALDPTGQLLFVAGKDEDAIAVFRRRPDGSLQQLDVVRDGVDGIDGLGGAVALSVSPDALHVYVAAETEDAVTAMKVVTLLLSDGFESGDLSAWSASAP